MRHYEIMIILDPAQDERTVAPSLDKYLDVVRKEKGNVDKVDIWGKRRLAIPFRRKRKASTLSWTSPVSPQLCWKSTVCST